MSFKLEILVNRLVTRGTNLVCTNNERETKVSA